MLSASSTECSPLHALCPMRRLTAESENPKISSPSADSAIAAYGYDG